MVKLLGPAYVYDRWLAAGLSTFVTPATYSGAVSQAHLRGLAFAALNLEPGLRQRQLPTLLVHGRQDPIGEAVPLHLQSCLASAELCFVNRCGHFPWLEQPQAFYAALRPFLARPVAASARH